MEVRLWVGGSRSYRHRFMVSSWLLYIIEVDHADCSGCMGILGHNKGRRKVHGGNRSCRHGLPFVEPLSGQVHVRGELAKGG